MNKIKKFKVLREALKRRMPNLNNFQTGSAPGLFVSSVCDRIGKDDLEMFLILLGVKPFTQEELNDALEVVDQIEIGKRCSTCMRTHYHCRCKKDI